MAAGYCASRGIPYEEFLEWGELSRDVAMGWQARENERCGGCGAVPSEWKAYNDDGTPVLDAHGHHMEAYPPKFVVDGSFCPACAALDVAHKDERNKRPGWRLFFRRNPDAD